MEPVFVMLHTEFLLHWGLLYSFFWNLGMEWLWLSKYQKVWGICWGWERCVKMKIPFSVQMEPQLQHILQSLLLERGTEGWYMKEDYTCRQQSCFTKIGLVFVI